MGKTCLFQKLKFSYATGLGCKCVAETFAKTFCVIVRFDFQEARAIIAVTMELAAEVEQEQQRWAGAELLVCAVIQLLLVNVAYRIDRMHEAPLLSTSSWAIFCGLLSGALLALVSKTVRVKPRWQQRIISCISNLPFAIAKLT
jgi:membrane associated rhomboid family serine protease